MASTPAPTVLVLAVPYLYATVIADELDAVGIAPVVVPNLDEGEWEPSERYRAVVASVPVPASWAEIVVQLPLSFRDPVLVTVDDVTVAVTVSSERPLREVAALLARHVAPDDRLIVIDEHVPTTPAT